MMLYIFLTILGLKLPWNVFGHDSFGVSTIIFLTVWSQIYTTQVVENYDYFQMVGKFK